MPELQRSGARGLTLFVLLFLAAGGGIYLAFRHADSNRGASPMPPGGEEAPAAAPREGGSRASERRDPGTGSRSPAARPDGGGRRRGDGPRSAANGGDANPRDEFGGAADAAATARLRVKVDPRDRLEQLSLHVRSPGVSSQDLQPVVGDVAEFVVPADDLRVRIEHPAARPLEFAITLEPDAVAELRYPPEPVPAPVRVVALDDLGRPVSGASVWIERWDRGRSLRTRAGVTDDHGAADVRGLEIAGTALTVGSDTLAVTRLKPDELAARLEELRIDDSVNELTVTLEEGGTVSVVVRDDQGRPVEDARVNVESVSVSAATRWRRIEANTDREGRARLAPISAARIELRVWDLILGVTRSDPIDVPRGEVTEVIVAYEAHAAVAGRVRRNGQPVSGGEVYFGGVSPSGDFMPVRDDGTFSGRVRRSRTALLHYVQRDPRVVVHREQPPVRDGEEIAFDYRAADLSVAIAPPPGGGAPRYRVRVVPVDGALHSAAAEQVEDVVVFPGVPLGRYQIIVHATGAATGHLESPIVDLTEPTRVEVSYRDTEPFVFPDTVAPVDVRAWAYPDEGGREAVTLLGTFPLAVAWPRGVTGWLVLEARGLPPEFTRVVGNAPRTAEFAFEPGTTLLPVQPDAEPEWSCRITPNPMLGPPAYWDRERRIGLPIALRAGSYHIDSARDGEPIARRTVTVSGEGVTEVRIGPE